jgi:hypothetical protein
MNLPEEYKTPVRVAPSPIITTSQSPALSANTASSASNMELKSSMAATREARLTPQEKELMLDLSFLAREQYYGNYLKEG